MSRWTVDIDEIPEEGLELALSEAPSFFDFGREDGAWRGPVRWAGTVQRFGRDVLCRGRATAGVRLPCSRCLRDVEVDLEAETVFTFAPEEPPESGEEVEVASEEADFYFYRGGSLNLREPVRDHLLMSVPLQPLCGEGCRGLCPQCGADLNEGPCGCEGEARDPRWEALARLRGR